MDQLITFPIEMTTSSIVLPLLVLAPPLLIQFSANASWEVEDGDSIICVHAPYVGEADGAMGAWLWPDPILAVPGIWKMNHQMKVPSLSLSATFILPLKQMQNEDICKY